MANVTKCFEVVKGVLFSFRVTRYIHWCLAIPHAHASSGNQSFRWTPSGHENVSSMNFKEPMSRYYNSKYAQKRERWHTMALWRARPSQSMLGRSHHWNSHANNQLPHFQCSLSCTCRVVCFVWGTWICQTPKKGRQGRRESIMISSQNSWSRDSRKWSVAPGVALGDSPSSMMEKDRGVRGIPMEMEECLDAQPHSY